MSSSNSVVWISLGSNNIRHGWRGCGETPWQQLPNRDDTSLLLRRFRVLPYTLYTRIAIMGFSRNLRIPVLLPTVAVIPEGVRSRHPLIVCRHALEPLYDISDTVEAQELEKFLATASSGSGSGSMSQTA